MWGHTHTEQGYNDTYSDNLAMLNASPSNREKRLSTPSGVMTGETDDFAQKLPAKRRGYSRTTPAMVVTGQSFSVYSAGGYATDNDNTHKTRSFRKK
jgi:hypothetical protein